MYDDLDLSRPFTGKDDIGDRCPICGATGECPEAVAVPMPFPPVDIHDSPDFPTGGSDG